jgi:hypothetical protein
MGSEFEEEKVQSRIIVCFLFQKNVPDLQITNDSDDQMNPQKMTISMAPPLPARRGPPPIPSRSVIESTKK